MNNHIVIMAGGVGSRFWPLSTPEFPKRHRLRVRVIEVSENMKQCVVLPQQSN